ncbi:MAG: alkaline phosphatase family protein [Polyangiaceae bacterium]
MLPGQTSTLSIVNLSGAAISVTTTPDPRLAANEDYALHDATLGESTTPVELLEVSRTAGITNGDQFLFSTEFELDGVRVTLEERLDGTLLGSKMFQRITAGPSTTGFQDTSAPVFLPAFTGASGATYTLGWTLETTGLFDSITYTVTRLSVGVRRVPPVLPQIHCVVMLMLENRSLDNVLGWLHADRPPAAVHPPGSPLRFDGIPEGSANAYHHQTLPVARNPLADPANGALGRTPCRAPDWDPHEPIHNVANQLYGGAWAGAPSPVPWAETPGMGGFAWDYAEFYREVGEVMGAYDRDVLPVLYGLAEGFATSDAWFASVPSETDPNRAFAICGTSNGFEQNEDFRAPLAATPTIFNLLALADKTSGIYFADEGGIVAGSPSGQPYTPYWFPLAARAPGITIGKVGDLANPAATPGTFASALAAGTLPHFCFLEPSWGGGVGELVFQGTDYHPPAYVGPGEAGLAELYEALRASPQWPNMLLIITFDEHGGLFDHVPPPRAIPPVPGMRGPSGFGFDRLGVRVPTILVSPYAPAGMVFRAPEGAPAFDHTSFIATLLKWAGIDPASAGMGDRVASASTFEDVLSSEARPVASFPEIVVPEGYRDQGKPLALSDDVVAHEAATAPPASTRDAHAALLGAAPSHVAGAIDVRAFRRMCAESEHPDELRAKLKAHVVKPPTS